MPEPVVTLEVRDQLATRENVVSQVSVGLRVQREPLEPAVTPDSMDRMVQLAKLVLLVLLDLLVQVVVLVQSVSQVQLVLQVPKVKLVSKVLLD